MPRIFFDIDDGFACILDDEGVDLSDRSLAQAFAAGLRSTFEVGEKGLRSRVLMRTEAGGTIEPFLPGQPGDEG